MHTDERTATGVRLLHSIFEHQAGRTPHATALELPPRRAGDTRQRLTYAELDARAEHLARRLSAWVTGECVVAVLLPRASAELWVALMAML